MTTTFAGLSRRTAAFIADRTTAEEISHIVAEAAELADGADDILELALAAPSLEDTLLGDDFDGKLSENDAGILLAVAEEDDDDLDGDVEDTDELTEEELAAIDGELDGLDVTDDDDESIVEAMTGSLVSDFEALLL